MKTVFILEVQIGDCLEEDDIIRHEDDYGTGLILIPFEIPVTICLAAGKAIMLYKGGDKINPTLPASAFNMQKLLRSFAVAFFVLVKENELFLVFCPPKRTFSEPTKLY